MNSTNLYVEPTNGEVFLISKFIHDDSRSNNFETITIGATNGITQINQTNVVSIINVNSNTVEFVSSQRVFEIEEVIFVKQPPSTFYCTKYLLPIEGGG